MISFPNAFKIVPNGFGVCFRAGYKSFAVLASLIAADDEQVATYAQGALANLNARRRIWHGARGAGETYPAMEFAPRNPLLSPR